MEIAASHKRVPVVEASQPSAARFAAHDAAEAAGFSPEDVYRAGLVATELATNLMKHATAGEILVRATGGERHEVELVSIDRGPGMVDVERSLTDGHSTTGTQGTGLGAVRRFADEFDVYSQPGRGTIILTRLTAGRKPTAAAGRFALGGVSVSLASEDVCGDSWQTHQQLDAALFAIVDGLGHGLHAHEASIAAITTIQPNRHLDLPDALRAMHEGTRHTRGAAGAVAEIRSRALKFAGVGNIAGVIAHAGTSRRVISLAGTLGHDVRQFREYSYPWEPDSVFIMYSDGLGSHWSIDDYRGLRQRDPVVIASTLYRDFSRQRDDVTVVVGRERSA